MPATARSYVVKSLFNSLVVSVSQDGAAIVHNSGKSYDMSRSEAANLLRYARVKNGSIRKLKSLPVG